MTNEELLQDLKQFIAITVKQETAQLATKDGLRKLDLKFDQLQIDIAEALSHLADGVATTDEVKDLRIRLKRLEQQAA